MKKKIVCALLMGLLAAIVFVLSMEARYGGTTLVPVGLSEEQIRKEMPGIAITPEDAAMGRGLLTKKEIAQALLDENGVYAFQMEEAERLLLEYAPEGVTVLELTVADVCVYAGFSKGEEQVIYYTFGSNGECRAKTIGVYGEKLSGERIVKEVYENRNGRITKTQEKHLWFAWLHG